MKNKKQSVQNAEDDKHEAAKGEENEENCSCSTDFLSNEDARCPICLNCLVEQEVGFPENCNHIFCMTCILKWAEIRTSCPVDRKQFKAVYKLNTSEDSVKVEIKQQICKKDDIISQYKGKNCPITMKTCKRKQENAGIHFLPILYKSWNPNYNPSNKEEVTNSVKKNKPKRQTCLNRFFKSNWYNKFSSNSSFSDVSPNYQNESIEINKIDAVIRHKRRELELSCSVLARVARISSISSEAEIATCLVLETVFSISTSPLENFGSSKSGHVVTCVHEGEEKKQTSGTTGTRGTKRKVSDTTPRRRSARNIKTETSYQSQSSPKSSNSGYEASGDGSSFVNVSFTELEKLTPKRKAKRNVKQQEPLAKKKLRSSGRYGKISSDIDFDEPDETEITLLLDKGNLADSENSTFDLTHKNDVDTESSNGLENSYVAYKKEPKEHCCEGQNTLDVLKTGSYVQDPPSLVLEKTAGSCDEYLLTLEGNTEKYEEKVDTETENKLYYKNAEQDQHLNISGEQLCDDNITFTHQSPELSIPTIELPAKLESLAVTHQIIESPEKELGKTECMLIIGDISAVSRHELLGGTESMAVADKLLTGTRNELQEKLESEVIANKPVSCHTNELRKPESSAIDGILEKPITQFTEEIVKEPLDNISNEIPLHSLGVEDVEIEEKELNIYVSNEYLKNTDLLINVSSENKLNLSFENDKPETETNTSPKMCAADIKQFNKDDSEIVSIEYNLFNIDQNASQLDHPLANDNIEQKANFLQNDSKHSVSFSNPDKKEAKESFTDKKTRTRRSRFHSPSTTWSPSKREGKRSQSPSPNREIVGEGRTSRSPKRDIFKESQRSLSKSPKRDPIISPSSSPRTENLKEKKQSLLSSPKKDHLREGRDSPTNSPKKDSIKDGISSSWTRAKESPPWHKCRSPSSDRVNDKNEFRRDNERGRSRRRWSQSRSRSRSRSKSRPRSKGPSFPRNERDGYSPPRWKERWTNDNWRSPRGSDKYKRNEQQKQTDCMKSERDSVNKEADMQSSSDQYRKDYPDWVMERINSVPETRNRERENFKNQQWEENRHNDSGASRSGNYGSGWNSNRGRGSHGRGSRGRGALTYGEQTESHWQNRKAHSRNANSSGNETSRFPEHHPYKRKAEQDFTFDTPADRSGWTSASSWAVRKTLPADVQNYYSRRGRNSSSPQSIWAKEEVASEQDPNFKDQTSQQSDASQLPVNVLQPQMNIMTPVNTQHQPMSIFPYTMGVPTPIMNIQHNPFNLPPVPMHLHSGLPLVQVAASSSVSQGPPPPPPPPPPSQQIKFIASQLDGQQLQAAPTTSHVVNSVNTTNLSALVTVESIQGPSSDNTASTNNIKSSNAAVKSMGKKINVTVEASADSSKKDQKLLIQEKAAQEVKLAIKPFYQNKDISKEEYKEIVRKAVDKVCHSKSGEVNSAKVANLVKAYVDKYKHSRKKNPDETLSVERK